MTTTERAALSAAGLLAAALLSAAASAPEPAPPAPGAGELSGAVVSETLSIPSPGEFFTAIGKITAPDWASLRRDPPPANLTDRCRIALGIGALFAGAHLAIHEQDPQQLKNISRDIITLAKSLGAGEELVPRGGRVSQLASAGEWPALCGEIEALQSELKTALESQLDEPLSFLVTLGAWLRAIEAGASALAAADSPAAADLLRQEAPAAYLLGRLDALPDRVLCEPAVRETRDRLAAIVSLLAAPASGTPAEQAARLRDEAARALNLITQRPR